MTTNPTEAEVRGYIDKLSNWGRARHAESAHA